METISEPQLVSLSMLGSLITPVAFRPIAHADFESAAVATGQNDDENQNLFALGFAQGEQAAQARFDAERVGLNALIASASALQAEPSEELAAMIATLVDSLVTDLVGTMPVEVEELHARITNALEHVVDADAARTLWMHPDDIGLIDITAIPLAVCADPFIERGALRIDCSNSWIEDGRSIHLSALRATLGIGDIA